MATFKGGSSPHTWGILGVPGCVQRHDRFIPTYVGHTLTQKIFGTQKSVHPHIRGAYHGAFRRVARCLGSSPHTWGIHQQAVSVRLANRFIPTYVGHTARLKAGGNFLTVHPHIRGAYILERRLQGIYRGSSPHTWGIRLYRYLGMVPPPVHPHIRGAYERNSHVSSPPYGSSPHTWGIPEHCHVVQSQARFIPTYVGHTPQVHQ